MKYVFYNGHAMTHKHMDKNPVRPITKGNPNHRLDTDGGESGTPTESSEGSIPIKTPKVLTVFIRSRHDDADSSVAKSMSEFEPLQQNGEQITVKDNKLLPTNFTVEIQN